MKRHFQPENLLGSWLVIVWYSRIRRTGPMQRRKVSYFIHYSDFIMTTIASQITSLMIVYSTVYSGADQSKHQSSASLAFVWGIHRGPVNSPHKWPVTRKMFPFDDVIMNLWYCKHRSHPIDKVRYANKNKQYVVINRCVSKFWSITISIV